MTEHAGHAGGGQRKLRRNGGSRRGLSERVLDQGLGGPGQQHGEASDDRALAEQLSAPPIAYGASTISGQCHR